MQDEFVLSNGQNEKKFLRITLLGHELFNAHRAQILLYLQSIDPTILKRVDFIHCDLSIANYVQILAQLPNIFELDFHRCKIQPIQQNDDTQTTAILKKLIKFQVMYYRNADDTDQSRCLELTSRILSASENMEDVRFHLSLPEGLVDRYEEIRAIVARQSRLEMLYIGDNRFFDGELSNPEFQLRSFFMPVKQSRFSENQLLNFRAFFATQLEISHLVCDVAVDYRSPMLKEIVKTFDSDDMLAFHQEYDGMVPNHHVKRLYAEYFGENDTAHGEIVNTMVEKYPQLENMEFNYNMIGEKTNMNLLVPVNKLENINRLSFLSLSNRQISRIKVPTLMSVEISFDDEDIESLNRFVTRHTQLEEMKLILEMENYESFMPGLYLFVEFALRVLANLKSFNVTIYFFEQQPIEREQLQQMINAHAQQDEFELTIDFEEDEDDRESEVFVKTI